MRPSAAVDDASLHLGTQFTCFTSTKVQILTPDLLQESEHLVRAPLLPDATTALLLRYYCVTTALLLLYLLTPALLQESEHLVRAPLLQSW